MSQVYTLDIVLDIEKLYPLIFRPQAEGGNGIAGKYLSGITCVVSSNKDGSQIL